MIGAEKIERTRDPLDQIFLQQQARSLPSLHHPTQPVVAGSHVKGFFPQHVRGRASERRKGRILEHLELELTIAVYKIGVGKKVEPVVHVNVEGSQQTFVLKRPPLQHLLRLDFARRSEEVDEQSAHLPAMTHLLDHDAGDRATIPLRGRGCKQVTLLLHAGKFSIALIDDHIHQGIPHLLCGNLAQILPLVAAFVGTELDFPGFDRSIERVKVEGLDVVFVDAYFFAPLIEDPDPFAEASDFRYFAWHKNLKSSSRSGTSSILTSP